jgi:hypothetical protein
MSIFRKTVDKFQVSLQWYKNNGYFTWRPICIFNIISRSILLRMKNVSDKCCRENKNILCSVTFFPENLAVYEIVWKNIVERDRPQMTIWRMCIACWITKATERERDTHTHTDRVCYTRCFSTAAMVARMRLIVTYIAHLFITETMCLLRGTD